MSNDDNGKHNKNEDLMHKPPGKFLPSKNHMEVSLNKPFVKLGPGVLPHVSLLPQSHNKNPNGYEPASSKILARTWTSSAKRTCHIPASKPATQRGVAKPAQAKRPPVSSMMICVPDLTSSPLHLYLTAPAYPPHVCVRDREFYIWVRWMHPVSPS